MKIHYPDVKSSHTHTKYLLFVYVTEFAKSVHSGYLYCYFYRWVKFLSCSCPMPFLTQSAVASVAGTDFPSFHSSFNKTNKASTTLITTMKDLHTHTGGKQILQLAHMHVHRCGEAEHQQGAAEAKTAYAQHLPLI